MNVLEFYSLHGENNTHETMKNYCLYMFSFCEMLMLIKCLERLMTYDS